MDKNIIDTFAEKVINDTLNPAIRNNRNIIRVSYEIDKTDDALVDMYMFTNDISRKLLQSLNIYNFPVSKYVRVFKDTNIDRVINRVVYSMPISKIICFFRNEGLKELLNG